MLILLLGAVQAWADSWLNFGGKSLAQYFILFLIGLFMLSHEEVQAKLEKFRLALLVSAFTSSAGYAVAIKLEWSGFANDALYYLYGYTAMLAILAFGRRHLNIQNKTVIHAAKSSLLYYILHYPVLTAAAYILAPCITNIFLQITAIILTSFILTILLSETIRRIPVIRTLFGIKV